MIKKTFSKLIILATLFPVISFAGNDTGKIKMRARLAVSKPESHNKFSSIPPQTISKAFSGGKGVNLAASYFFNERIASEVTVGVHYMLLKHAAEVASAFGGTGTALAKKRSFLLPLSLGVQYYPLKTSFLNGYIGTGFQFTFITNNKNAKISNNFSTFAQTGIDVFNPHSLVGVNFDIKKYWQKVDIKYKVPTVSNTPLKNQAKVNPWVFSLGVFYEFQ
jgi:outer membrane protein W